MAIKKMWANFSVCFTCNWIHLEDMVTYCEKCGGKNIIDIHCPEIYFMSLTKDKEIIRDRVRMCLKHRIAEAQAEIKSKRKRKKQ